MVNKLNSAIKNLHNIKVSFGWSNFVKQSPAKKSKDKNFSLFKKYLNPWNKSQIVVPSTTKNVVDHSMQFKSFEKKKVKVTKKHKKSVNYTTIRKQIPSFERSVDSAGSGIRILRFTKPIKENSNSSQNVTVTTNSIVGLANKTLTNKSLNLSTCKAMKDAKIIRLSKDLKAAVSKPAKSRKKEEISKWEIDLSKSVNISSSRGQNMSATKEQPLATEKSKIPQSLSTKSKSPEYQELSSGWEEKFPMQAGRALKLFMNNGLTIYEQNEILEYKQVYFIGNTDKKIDGSKSKNSNWGFDDDRGDYKIIPRDHIDYRYEIISTLGQGSFGQVVKVLDHKTKKHLALKIIRNKKKFEYQANIEIKVLNDIKENDPKDKSNIIKIINHFTFRKHICLTFELYSINLYELIKNNEYNGFPLDIIRRFAIQILQGLRFLKKREIIHWDLKPENILLKKNNKTGIKIIDLGSSCFKSDQVYTYIQSRFYRAPEIMLGIPYSPAIDMWSFAWILVELYIGYPLFPGESEEEQFSLIMEYKGAPPINLLENATRRELFFDDELNPIIVKDSLGDEIKPNSKALSQLLSWGVNEKERDETTSFVKFIDACLHWDPDLRLTPNEALHHEWISSIFGRI